MNNPPHPRSASFLGEGYDAMDLLSEGMIA